MGSKNKNLNHIPQGLRFLFHCGLCSLQRLWLEGGHWCRHPPCTALPGRRRKGELRGLQWEPRFSEWAFCQPTSPERGFYWCIHRGFHGFPRWSSCSHQKEGPESPPDLSHKNAYSRWHPHPTPLRIWGCMSLRSGCPAGQSHGTATICQEADGARGRGL